MSLIWFHRILIASAIVFCFGYAAWEFVAYTRGEGTSALLISLAFALAGIALSFYLRHLRRFLRLSDQDSPSTPDDTA